MEQSLQKLTPSEKKYLETMDVKEREAYEIARKHLGSSFSLKKSIGYKKFIQANK